MEKKNVWQTIVFCFGAVALNLLGAWCIRTFEMPLYLDSISTLATAFLFGLVPSIFVAVATNVIMYFTFSAPLIFTTCHIMTAVGTWAVFKFDRKKQTPVKDDFNNHIIDLFLFAGLLSALTNGVFGSVYSVMLSQTHKETLVKGLSGFLILITNNLPLSHFWSGIVTNLADKTLGAMISFMIALGVRKVQNDNKKDESIRVSVSKKSSSYRITTILIILSAINIISCFVFQKRYRVISGTEPTLESSLYIMILASIILIASCFFILYAKVVQGQKEKELADRQREWQQKLAFDLHDGVLQNLVALNASLESQLQTEETSSQIQFIKSAASELRFLCGILRVNDEVPFEESLHHTIDAYEKTYGFKINLGIATDLSVLNSNQKVELLRILYECLSNTTRHSDAKKVSVTFADDGSGKLYFTVRDDGQEKRSFDCAQDDTSQVQDDISQVQDDTSQAQDNISQVQDDSSQVQDDTSNCHPEPVEGSFHGLGLNSIKTRAENLGGEVEFSQTADGWTTRVVLSV